MDFQLNIPLGSPRWFGGGAGLLWVSRPPWVPTALAGRWMTLPESRVSASIYLFTTHLLRKAHPLKSAGTAPSTWRSTHCAKGKQL